MKQVLSPSDSNIDKLVEKSDTDPMELSPELEVELAPRDTIVDPENMINDVDLLDEIDNLPEDTLEALRKYKLPKGLEQTVAPQRRYRAEPPIRKLDEESL